MKSLFVVCILIVSIEAIGQYKDWHQGSKLSWTDFKITKKNLVEESDGYITKAKVNTGFVISVNINGDIMSFEVINRMYSDKSWVHPSAMSSQVLMHEQGHFDIREYFSRLMRKMVKEYKFNLDSIPEELNVIEDKIKEQLKLFQKEYDKKTDYGCDYKNQVLFCSKIDSLLNVISDYREISVINKLENSPRILRLKQINN